MVSFLGKRCRLGLGCLQIIVTATLVTISGFSYGQTKVVLGSAKDPNLGAEMIIARDKGFYREQGLDVELKFFPSGGDLMSAFVGGSVQMGSSGLTPLTILAGRPYPVKVVCQMADIAGAQQFIVKQNVKTLDELYGKKIALLRGTAPEALWNAIVRTYNFDASKVEIINMGGAEMVQTFTLGAVDAVVLWEPFSTRARKRGNGKVLVSGTNSYVAGREGPQRIFGDRALLFASENYIRSNPEAVRAVIRALAKASDFIENNKAEATAILAKEFDFDTDDMTSIMNVNRYTLTLDDGLAYDMNQLAEFMYGLKRIPKALKAKEWIDTEPLQAVRPALVQLK
jgi:NitT/TauT family transport system substrate-binding protein